MALELDKKAQKVGLQLAKLGLTKPPVMRVAFGIDCSYSMDDEFKDGSVQIVNDQLLAVGVKFDDDGSIDVFKFADDGQYVGTCTEKDYGRYIRDKGLKPYGGTAYSPLVRVMTDHFFGNAPAPKGPFGFFSKKPAAGAQDNTPVLALIVTDGAPGNEGNNVAAQVRAIRPSLVDAQRFPIYFHFIGVSNQPGTFGAVERLADDLPNVGFVQLSGFNKTDDEIYKEIICPELVEWIKKTDGGSNTVSA